MYFTTGERDFLIPAVWEGTGDELHTNRLVAAASDFGGRIMSGIATMTLAIARLGKADLGTPPPPSNGISRRRSARASGSGWTPGGRTAS